MQITMIKQIIAEIPNRTKFKVNMVASGCWPIAPGMYPETASNAKIPEFVIVFPHFCAKRLREAIKSYSSI